MIKEIVNKQRAFYQKGETLDLNYRKRAILKLKKAIETNQELIFDAFSKDYNKGKFDVITTELTMIYAEINYMLKHINKFFKPKRVRTNLINFPAKSFIYHESYGVTLVMAPWNYPLQLTLLPLVSSIACGNTTVLKPSQYAPNVALAIKKILEVFDEEYIAVVLGGREENTELLDQKFDFIFFTGGDVVGRIVMEKASKNLTPVCLELGGKSPCIVTLDADLELAAKRITWGKYLNAGQTCVAPDYILVDEKIKDKLIKKIIEKINGYYYKDNKINVNFPYIINDKHLERVLGLINPSKIIYGGKNNGRLLEPTILDNVTFDDKVMQEEIFGPILPVITFKDINGVIEVLKQKDKPLALYLFTNDKEIKNKVLLNLSFGGGCVNDVIMHLTNHHLPFGGVGKSGMGSYHGEKSLLTFSHEKSVFIKGKAEINIKYPPYNDRKLNIIKRIMKVK